MPKKGCVRRGVYVRQGYSSVSATDTAIRCMIKVSIPTAVRKGQRKSGGFGVLLLYWF